MPRDDIAAQIREQDEDEARRRMVELLDRDPTAEGVYDPNTGVLEMVIVRSQVPTPDGSRMEEQILYDLDCPPPICALDVQGPIPARPDPRYGDFVRDIFRDLTWSAPQDGGELMTMEQYDRETRGRSLGMEERAYMLHSASRIEAELRWVLNNNATVRRAYNEARSLKLSETTAAEMALICMARENEDLRQPSRSLRKTKFRYPTLEQDYMI